MSRARRILFLLPVALVAAAVLATVALAAPDRTLTLSSSATTATWDGSGAFGATPRGVYECRVGGVYNCDDSLVDLKDGGTLKASAEIDNDESGQMLLNFFLYKAGANGEPEGEAIAESELGASSAMVAKGLKTGQYVLRIVFRAAVNASFTAKATLTPDAPAAVTTTPVVTTPLTTTPAATTPASTKTAPATKKKPSCKAKARKIKNAKKRKAALKRCARAKRR